MDHRASQFLDFWAMLGFDEEMKFAPIVFGQGHAADPSIRD
jgi:hypothetical protein